MHAWLDDSDDHLRWLAPTDLNLDYMGITHLDCVTLVSWATLMTISHGFADCMPSTPTCNLLATNAMTLSHLSAAKCLRNNLSEKFVLH